MNNFIVEEDFYYKDFHCVIIGNSMGYRCGYIKINEPSQEIQDDYSSGDLGVHGGITYGAWSQTYPVKDEGFWLGFDCGHYGDSIDFELVNKLCSKEDAELINRINSFGHNGESVRSQEYVREELKHLADQLNGSIIEGGI